VAEKGLNHRMKLSDHMMLWNHVYIKVMDVRHTVMVDGEQLRSYRLPASAFLFVKRGRAQLMLDGKASTASRFHVLHLGKGLDLDILAEQCLEFYMILYKAVLPLPCRQELVKLMEEHNPFRLQYDFVPQYPFSFIDTVERMSREWQRAEPLEKLHVKALFYQWVHEVLKQLHQQQVPLHKPDPVMQAVRYMHDHYKEAITLESMASMLECNSRQFLRMFKSRMNTSPIDYLIQLRMNKAKERLLTTDFTLKEIAESVGYADSYYFSRIFKKYEGVSPTAFKERGASMQRSRNNPSRLSVYPIAANKLRRYIDDEYENHYQYSGEEDLPMYRKSRTSMLASVLFCFVLLLSACGNGGAAAGNTGSGSGGSIAASAQQPVASPQAEATRVVKHAMGEATLTGTPKRVVILTNEGTEALLAVGVKPVGAVKSWSGDPWYPHIKDDMKDVAIIGDEIQPNIELIASLKPDLIIGSKARQEKIYEQLKKIAPTVFSETMGGEWKSNFKLYMEALNKKDDGDKLIAAFDKRVNEVKTKLGSKVATKVSLVRFSVNQVRIYQKQTFAGVLLDQLGLARPAAQDKDSFIEVMSKERIPDMDGDVMFYFVTETPGKDDVDKVVQDWMNDRLFKNLNVSKNNKVKRVDEAIWNSAGGYEAANLLLDEISAYFEVK